MTRIAKFSALGCFFVASTYYGVQATANAATNTHFSQDNRSITMAAAPVHKGMTTIYRTDREIITKETIKFGDCYWNDINTRFIIPEFPGYSMVEAELILKYYDVDFYDQPVDRAELDVVGVGDSRNAIDVLKGKSGSTTMTKSWNVFYQIKHDTGSGFFGLQINIDAANYGLWCLGLREAILTTRSIGGNIDMYKPSER